MMKRHNFSENSSCCLRDGSMLFGYSHGMFVFDPENVKNNTFNPYLALVQFRLFNRSLQISDQGPLYKSIDLIERLQLKHNQNFLVVSFFWGTFFFQYSSSSSFSACGLSWISFSSKWSMVTLKTRASSII